MRTIKDTKHSITELADHRESISEVLIKIDNQLKTFNLEVVQISNGSDAYEWYISERSI